MSEHLIRPSSQGEVLWTTSPAGGHNLPGSDGIIFSSTGQAVRALNPDGSLEWGIPTGDVIVGGPAVGPDGNIYAVDDAEFGGLELESSGGLDDRPPSTAIFVLMAGCSCK